MRHLLLITLVSYALLGSGALAGVSFAAPAPVSPEDTSMMTPRHPPSCKQARANVASVAMRGSAICMTECCISETEDQGKREDLALLLRGYEVIHAASIAAVDPLREEWNDAVQNNPRESGKRSLIATITASVILRE